MGIDDELCKVSVEDRGFRSQRVWEWRFRVDGVGSGFKMWGLGVAGFGLRVADES